MRSFPAIGLAVALLAGIFTAWSPRYWPVAVAIAALAVTGAAWACSALEIRLPWHAAIVVPVACWGALQVGLGLTLIPSVTLRTSLVWLMCGVAFVLASQALRERRDRNRFLELMLWGVTTLAVEALLQIYTEPVRVFGIFPAAPSVFGTMFYTNHFAALMELTAPIALWMVSRGRVAAGSLGYAALFAATVATGSRAGLILLIAELLVFLAIMLIGRGMPLKSALPIFLVLIVLGAAASMVAGTQKIQGRFHDKNPYAVRRSLFLSSVRMAEESPWCGFGMGTWRSVYPRFATFDMAVLANEAHNDWAQWAAEGGIPFVLLLLILVIWLSIPAIESIWGLGILAMALHAVVDYPMREPALQLFWFVLAGALAILRSEAGDGKAELFRRK